jgi:hypothetical protein
MPKFDRNAATTVLNEALAEVAKRPEVVLKPGGQTTEWKSVLTSFVLVLLKPVFAKYGLVIPEELILAFIGAVVTYIGSRTYLKR